MSIALTIAAQGHVRGDNYEEPAPISFVLGFVLPIILICVFGFAWAAGMFDKDDEK